MTQTACQRCGAALGPAEAGSALQGMCTRCLMELGLEEDSHVVITGSAEAPAPPPCPEELQPLFPHLEIEAVLGQGGMGVVYRARQTALDRPVALKVLPAKLGRDPAFAERFAREARALAALDHPNVTRVFDFGKAGEHHYFVLELVDGADLRQLLRAGRIEPRQALQIVEEVCDALQYAHDQGVVHRDIKPENVLVDRKGRVKITDFGLAKLVGAKPGPTELTLTRQVMGTPHYMAPEQIERPASVDHRADIYSLGVVFYELLTGELPLGRFAPPSGKVEVDVKLDEVVLRALEKEPARRYQTARAVRTDVHAIEDPGSGAARVEGWTAESAAGGVAGGAGAAGAAGGAGKGAAGAGRGGEGEGEGGGAAVGGGRRKRRGLLVGVAVAVVLFGACLVPSLLFLGLFAMPGEIGEVEFETFPVVKVPPPHEFEDATIARLAGIPLFATGEGGQARVSPALRETFGVSADASTDVTAVLEAAHERYEALLEEHTEVEIVSPDVARVTLEAFPDAHATFLEEVEREVAALLPRPAARALRERDAIALELFPQGPRRVAYELRAAPGGYAWHALAPDGALLPTAGTDLPLALRRRWQRLFDALVRPLGPSAVAPLERFLALLEVLEQEGAAVELGSVAVRGGATKSRSTEVRLRADLVVRAGDASRSVELLSAALDREERSGARAELGNTRPTREGDGIVAPQLELVLDAPNPGIAGLSADAPEEALDLVLLRAAEKVGLRPVQIERSRSESGHGFEDATHQLSLPKEGAPLASIRDLLGALEALGRASVVTEIDLARLDADAWRGAVRVRARRPSKG